MDNFNVVPILIFLVIAIVMAPLLLSSTMLFTLPFIEKILRLFIKSPREARHKQLQKNIKRLSSNELQEVKRAIKDNKKTHAMKIIRATIDISSMEAKDMTDYIAEYE